ncbi:MAG: hypothetical protein Q8O67_05660 [Deltaproteobacteria bacterium]|nr:hypothetical protein [Deltaproteobacteria bacterium]
MRNSSLLVVVGVLVVVATSSAWAGVPMATRAPLHANDAAPGRIAPPRKAGGDELYGRLRGLLKPGTVLSMPVAGDVTFQLRTSRSGDVALGPQGFHRRASAASNPMALIGRFDSNATSVVSAGLGSERLKLEGSVFNGQKAASVPQSYAARLSMSPIEPMSMQVSYASVLTSARRARLTRVTASTTVLTAGPSGSRWATTALWGAALSADDPLANNALVETDVLVDAHHNLFGRLEYDQRSAAEVGADGAPADVGNATLGYIYTFSPIAAVIPGVGVAWSLDSELHPAALFLLRGTIL